MAAKTYEVERMHSRERPWVIGALARAFYDDPLFNYFIADPVGQSRGLLSFMGASLTDAAPFGEVWVAHTGGKVACGAVWLPPGTYPRGTRRDLMTNLRGIPAFARSGRRIAGALRLLAALDKAHHEINVPHYYLAILGTDPLYQRMGAGSATLQPVLQRCDTEGVVAYLETQKEENIAYYVRHSFELIDKIDVEGVPPVWTLSRQPRPS